MTKQIKPNRLPEGARIGIVSPAYWLESEQLQRAVTVFEELGYELVPGNCTGLRENRFAGSPAKLFLSGGLCDNPLFVNSFPCELIPLGRFVLLSGLKRTAERRDKAAP